MIMDLRFINGNIQNVERELRFIEMIQWLTPSQMYQINKMQLILLETGWQIPNMSGWFRDLWEVFWRIGYFQRICCSVFVDMAINNQLILWLILRIHSELIESNEFNCAKTFIVSSNTCVYSSESTHIYRNILQTRILQGTDTTLLVAVRLVENGVIVCWRY